ncbi:hypothetical protein V3N99_14920 [Dermatophilaceae bacterium Soc4.6]
MRLRLTRPTHRTPLRSAVLGGILALAVAAPASVLPVAAAQAVPHPPAVGPYGHVLLVGDNDDIPVRDPDGPMGGITRALTAVGSRVDSRPALPDDLSAYGQIWSIHAYSGLGSVVEGRLIDFARAGGSILLVGDNASCCGGVKESDKRIVDALVAFPAGGIVLNPARVVGAPTQSTATATGPC